MKEYFIPELSSTRRDFVDAFPQWADEHKQVQKAMYATAREMDLPVSGKSRERMIGGFNNLFGINLKSRKQLTIDEMKAGIIAMESGLFDKSWNLIDDTRCRIASETHFYNRHTKADISNSKEETLDEYIARVCWQFDKTYSAIHKQRDAEEFAELEEYEAWCASIHHLIDELHELQRKGAIGMCQWQRQEELEKWLEDIFEEGVPVPLNSQLDESELQPESELDEIRAQSELKAELAAKTPLRLVAA